MRHASALLVALLVLCRSTVSGQATLSPLRDFVGTYRDAPGHSLEIVEGESLFAVLDDAKYRLRRIGNDLFLANSGDTIPFRRDAAGTVTGYIQGGVLRIRLSSAITSTSAALAWPRGNGPVDPLAYRYRAPADRHDGVTVGNVSASDLDVATVERVVRNVLDGTYKDVHSVLLYQRGALVLEEYFYGYDVARTHQLRSASKSIVSALAGIAIDRGLVSGVGARVLPLLQYAEVKNPDSRKAQITLGDLLTMRPGFACNDYDGTSPGRETAIYEFRDWVKAVIDLPMSTDPGSVAHYCSGGVAVVGRTVERASHQTLPAFADAHLFSPLGIPRANWTWDYRLTSANKEYAQIHLRPRDMLKVGLVYASAGLWHNTRVISAEWVKASLSEQSQIDGTGYGYFWWRPWLSVTAGGAEHRVYVSAAQGNGGQKIYIVPELDLVAVFTGGDYNSGGSPPNKIMAAIILPQLIAARARK